MISYWFERIGKMWRVYAYKDLERAYAIQDCFTRREARAIAERLDGKR